MDRWDVHIDAPPTWTAAPNRWATMRRATAALLVSGLVGWGVWTLSRHMPAYRAAPAIAHVDVPKALPDVAQRPARVHAVADKAAGGPVVTDVTQRSQ